MDDSRIVDLFLARDEAAIKESAMKYGQALRKIANNILSDQETVAECENDTYLKAWESIPPNEPRHYLFAFLARIIRFTAINRIRENSRKTQGVTFVELSEEIEICLPAPGTVEEEIDGKELSRTISAFLRNLDEEKRNIFIRRYWYMDSVKDIALFYRVTEGKVKSTLFRVRNDLKDHLKKEGYYL